MYNVQSLCVQGLSGLLGKGWPSLWVRWVDHVMPWCCPAGEGASPSAGHQANGTADAASDHSAAGAVENGGPGTSTAAELPEANGDVQQSAEAVGPADEILLIPADAGSLTISSD